MSYTKRQFVTAALTEIGIASYDFDLQPEEMESALRRLDAMIMEWNGKGVRLFWPAPSSPEDSDLDEETRVKDVANEAIITNLAIRIAPSFGKTVLPDTKMVAKQGFNTLLSLATLPPEMQMPSTMPAGAGHKRWRDNNSPFLRQEGRGLQLGPDSFLELAQDE